MFTVSSFFNPPLTLLKSPLAGECLLSNSDNNNSTSWSLFFWKYILIFRGREKLFRGIVL